MQQFDSSLLATVASFPESDKNVYWALTILEKDLQHVHPGYQRWDHTASNSTLQRPTWKETKILNTTSQHTWLYMYMYKPKYSVPSWFFVNKMLKYMYMTTQIKGNKHYFHLCFLLFLFHHLVIFSKNCQLCSLTL